MHTKERFHLTVRLLCFGLLLAAFGFRFAYALTQRPAQRASAATEATQEYPSMHYEPPEQTTPAVFSDADAVFAPILNWSGAEVNAQALISEPLEFTLSDKPVILIIHTHATESYCEVSGYRTTDTEKNVVRVGASLAGRLNESGICTLHDTTLIDHDGYYDAYARAAEIIGDYLQKYPTIQMVIDLHRDSVTDADGRQLALSAQYQQQSAAQMMLVMGTDAAGQAHPNWRQNLSFALKLQALCEQQAPGIFRDLNLRSQRYNQHLTPYSILIEVGTAGNTLAQALCSADLLAECLIRLLNP